MKKQNSKSEESGILRQMAEELLQRKEKARFISTPATEVEKLKLIHELQVHQIELEMQNEELVIAKEKAELAEEKYAKLYDFAPSGYLSLSKQGEILELNYAAARMLGKEKSLLINSLFGFFVKLDSRIVFADFLEEIFRDRNNAICDVSLSCSENDNLYAHLTGNISENWEYCNVTIIDITVRKKAEDELQKSEEKYHLLFENNPQPMWIYDLETLSFLEVNKEAVNHYGYSKEEFLSMTLKDIRPAEDIPALLENIRNTNSGLNTAGDWRHLKKNGEIIVVEITSHSILFNDRKARHILINDITERKFFEKELLKLSRAVEQSPASIIITDLKGNIEYVNPKTLKITGYTKDELIGKNPRIFSSGEKSKAEYKQLWSAISTGNEWIGEFSNKKKSGELYWESASISPVFNERGEATHYVAVKEDITERKKILEELIKAKERAEESEARLLEAQKATKVGSWDTDLSNLKVIWSEETYRIFEINSNTFQASHQAFLNFVHPDDKKIVDDAFIKSFETKDYNSIEHRIITAKNTIKYVEERWKIVFNEQGNPTRAIGTCQDITDSKQAEQELKEAKEKAEESDRLKSAFLANMSHEIRTPMNGILGFAYLLKDSDLSGDEQQEYIGVIEKSGKRMLNIINDIVDISKIEAGLMESDINEFNINEQIDYTYTFFKPEAEAKGINLSFKTYLPNKEATITSDGVKVYAILTNLVKNSIKYTEKGSIEFGYNLKKESGHNQLEFFVKDTGIGIPKDRQEAIFERFIQADIADKEARQGAGLGLSIAKAYVELLGGKIWVESEEGIGSTFYFTLPYNPETTTETNDQPLTAADNNNDVTKLKIMIAEDDETSEILIERYIKIITKEILKARTGFEAVEVCRNNPDIDLILMDIQMPVMNGYDATRQIRQFNKAVIIIAQTAFGLSGDREKAIVAGCNEYIAKPIDKEKLLSLIGKYVN